MPDNHYIKVLIIAPTFYPDHGGAGFRYYHYLPYFNELGVQVSVICGTPKAKKITSRDCPQDWAYLNDGVKLSEVNIDTSKIIKYKIPGSGSKERAGILLDQALKMCADKATCPNVVLIIAPMPYKVIDKLKKIKNYGVKLIYSHTIAKQFSRNLLIRLSQRWKLKQVYKLFDRVLVQSIKLEGIINDINPALDIAVIPNGVDVEKFSPVECLEEKIQLRKSLELPIDSIIITLIGAVHPRKGTHLLIQAWARLIKNYPELNLILIGPRYDMTQSELLNFRNEMDGLIIASGKKSNVHFLGKMENVELYLRASDFFVFPSEREGMPNAVLEAMACGLPIVLTPFIGLSEEMGEENRHYLLASRTSPSLCDSISRLLNDSELCSELSINARDWVTSNMSIKRSVQQHVHVFRACLNS